MSLTKEQDSMIAQLYEEMKGPLSSYAYSILRNKSLAEEAVQETFRIACTKPKDLADSRRREGWLMETLKNVISNMNRSHASLNRVVIEALPFDETFLAEHVDPGNVDILYSDLLHDKDYALLKRIALDKYSILEAAQELGISIEACKKRVQRAKKRLQKILKENK